VLPELAAPLLPVLQAENMLTMINSGKLSANGFFITIPRAELLINQKQRRNHKLRRFYYI